MERRLCPEEGEESAVYDAAAGRPKEEAEACGVEIGRRGVRQMMFYGDAVRDEAEDCEGETRDEGAGGVDCCVCNGHGQVGVQVGTRTDVGFHQS